MASYKWDRLIRYLTAEHDKVHYGEPILKPTEEDDIAKLALTGELRARRLEGPSWDKLKESNQTDTVFRLLGPLEPSDVPLVRCIGINYKTHISEIGIPIPRYPTVFTKPRHAVADHNEDILIPKIAQAQCDYEGELTIVIGKSGKDISEEAALDYIAGFTVGNDVSARDWQREAELAGPRPQWTFSKSFDKYAPLGPCIVATHLLGEANDCELKVSVNGSVRQHSNTSDLLFGVRKLVAFCSQGQTLEKGSLIMTGTPGGVGLFRKPPEFLQTGDVVDVYIQGIGVLSNRMAFE